MLSGIVTETDQELAKWPFRESIGEKRQGLLLTADNQSAGHSTRA